MPHPTASLYKITLSSILTLLFIIVSIPAVDASKHPADSPTATGYSALKLLLEDEQYLTTIRRTRMVLTFSDINNDSRKLIDSIADSSEQALEEMETLTQVKPQIRYVDFSDDSISKATFDSLRMTEGKEFLFGSDDFEKNLLISQLKILRVISHLAIQLEEQETNLKRKKWLIKLAANYEDYYQKVNQRISIHIKKES